MPPRERILVDCKDVEHSAARAWLATWLAIAALVVVACQPGPGERDQVAELGDELDNAVFRDRVVAVVRGVAAGEPNTPCALPPTAEQPLRVAVSLYDGGAVVGRGTATHDELCVSLKEAAGLALAASGYDSERVEQARFVVELVDLEYALVEHDGHGVELVGGLVPARVLDRDMVRRRIDEGTAYLLRVMDPELGGVHKYYHAPTDSFDDRLHTIYTASTLYTLLAVYARDRDERLRQPIERAAGFLLSMQRVAPGQPAHGAFHYSLDLRRHEREPRFVVGTTSKSIFTLIDLHAFSGDPAYLDAARLAADWLLTMQDEGGRVASELRLDADGAWSVAEQESLLYTGQVLSALSRLYEVTDDPRYRDAAAHTAGRLADRTEREGCYLGDDYRQPNPISSSWVVLSLFDFARAGDDPAIRKVVYDCADELLAQQIDDPADVYRHGRWQASLSSSGNGWLAEVLSELYLDCPRGDGDGCARFQGAVILLFRLLTQYTYSPANSFMTKNPAMAEGGLFWNPQERYVRTDSVCHAMNAYVFMVDRLGPGVLVELPEPPLVERLGLAARSGRVVDEVDRGAEEEDEFAAETVK
ncbi:terpene cyclase/mutase family protein [Nannocystis sp. ILAH1]|uniref:prenyltransferase/squalene oxidase repeat-containing protein n=1 Tax=Nannocystis sp. ILAH1 TaxID=2996789 RepID=UPI00226FA856|nr:prenyltransferase/squalene oxidase repeat-containing protein [Nannocystis sp. ILAH1]MCY0986491.1 terpene cyclase/mutase family protein [Nannocystis sp. ILAH1]